MLTILFLANLVFFVWIKATTPSRSKPDVMTELLKSPLKEDQDAGFRLELLEGLPEQLRNSDSTLSWTTPLLLTNAIVFLLSIAYVSAMHNRPGENTGETAPRTPQDTG